MIALSLVSATLLLGACGYDDGDRGYGGYGGYGGNGNGYGGGNGYPPSNQQALLEVLHASPDAPPVNVLLDGQTLYSSLDYAQGTGQIPVDASTSHTLAIQAQTPGAPTTVIGPLTESFAADTVYTVVAEGPVASIGPVVFSHPQSAIAPSMTRVQVLHAAPAAPSVAVYVTAPGAALASSAPFATFAFKGSVGPTDIPSGEYEIRVTPAGAVTPVLFDSGTVNLEPGEDLLLAAVQNTGPGTAPVAIASVDQNGRNQLLLDVATPATVRVVHDVADAPAIAVLANGNAAPLVASLAFPNFTAYLPETPGQYALAVTPATNTGDVLLEQPVNLSAGSQHSVYALGTLAALRALVTRDDDRRIATQAELRIIHGSPSAGPVDVYLVPTGSSIAAVAPTFASVLFGDDTGFQGVVAGAYDVIITPAGSKTAAIGPLAVTLKDSGIYTAVARDAAGGGTPLGLILLDDFAG
jgi:hypothetical protein